MEDIRMTVEEQVFSALTTTLAMMEGGKPNDRSEKGRLWAIVKTDLQKVEALWSTWILPDNILMYGKTQVILPADDE